MPANSLTSRNQHSFAKFGRPRTYGTPRHLNDYLLKDIGITADNLGLSCKR